MQIDLILAPYDLGKHCFGAGKGPRRIADMGAPTLRKAGHVVREHNITLPAKEDLTDTQMTFLLDEILSEVVNRATKSGSFPVVLAGNCITAVGTIAGLQSTQTGVLWLDAHGDFNTPETTQSGYLDGMALSAVCGHCWSSLIAGNPLHKVVPENNVHLVGARDLDPQESLALEKSQVELITSEQLRSNGCRILQLADTPVQDLYVHLDADVMDASVGQANRFASKGGLFPHEIENLLSWVAESSTIRALAITAYNPDFDKTGAIARALTDILASTIEAISRSGHSAT